MNWNCVKNLGHNYQKVGRMRPIRNSNEFSSYDYAGHFSLGRCEFCGTEKLIQCTGRFTFYHHDMITKSEYMAEHQGEQ